MPSFTTRADTRTFMDRKRSMYSVCLAETDGSRIYSHLKNTNHWISTMTIISLMDSAFSFFQNYPCRLAHIEMDCDLPCEESVFGSIHPFAEPNFRLSRELTVSEAFQNLFDERPEDPPHSLHESSKQEGNPMGLTVYDMFLLIHRMSLFSSQTWLLLIRS